jgi:hypothetical protein
MLLRRVALNGAELNDPSPNAKRRTGFSARPALCKSPDAERADGASSDSGLPRRRIIVVPPSHRFHPLR